MDPNLQHKSQTSATNATLPSLKQGIWGHIWKGTVEKNQTNATNVTLPLLSHLIWGGISKRTVEKNLTNVISVTLHHLMQTLWRSIWEWMHSGENQTNVTSATLHALMQVHLKTHSGEKPNKCNQCDYASIWGHIWKRTVKKSQTNATNVTMLLLGQAIWESIWKCTVE